MFVSSYKWLELMEVSFPRKKWYSRSRAIVMGIKRAFYLSLEGLGGTSFLGKDKFCRLG